MSLLVDAADEGSGGFASRMVCVTQGSLAQARQPFAMMRKAVGLQDKDTICWLKVPSIRSRAESFVRPGDRLAFDKLWY